ncbi:MAG: ABC transporter substrate-binding protein [Roseinatronobacter sp.]|nr:ABC transporter substrate-binding protein [Roseinatronobacter sp.]
MTKSKKTKAMILLSASYLALTIPAVLIAPGNAMATGPGKTLNIRFYDDPAGFDPTNIFRIENENIAFNIFSGLTSYDSQTAAIIPDLAESWHSDDNIVWTFNLRRGVQWHHGYGEFTAADVLYTFERNMDPETASPYVSRLANVVSVEAPDDYTVIITLNGPDGNFLHTVANYHQGMIVNREAILDAGQDVRWRPVGTGPFYLDDLDVNSYIILKRHEDYFRGPAPIETLNFRIIKDEQTATIALRNGEVDVVMRSNRQQNIDTLREAGFKLNRTDDLFPSVRIFNLDHPVLSDVRVRQAFAYAIDYPTIINAVTPDIYGTASSILMPWMDVYCDDIPTYSYDPDKARALLEEAGYGAGFTIRQLSAASGGVPPDVQFEMDFLAQVGIDLQLELVDAPTFNQRRNSGEFELAGRGIPAINPDMVLFAYLHPDNKAPAGLNGARYHNPELTALLEGAQAEVDPEKRLEMYCEVQRIAMTDLPYQPIRTWNAFWPSAPNVTGVTVNMLSQVNYFEVDIE